MATDEDPEAISASRGAIKLAFNGVGKGILYVWTREDRLIANILTS
jgi:hypothetical protein